MTMQEHVDAYLSWLTMNRGRSARTAEVYRLALRRLEEFLAGRDALQVTPDELVLFAGKWLFDCGLRDPASRKTHVSAIRGFYRFLHTRRLLQSNPADLVDPPKTGRRLPDVMTLEHAEAMLWGCDFTTFEGVRDAAIMAVLMGCGLRVSGLVGLNESNLIPTRIDMRQRLVIRTTEKGGKERQLPVPYHADLLLRVYLEHPTLAEIDRTLPSGDRVLFVSTRNRMVAEHEYRGEARRLRRKGINRLLIANARRAGVPLELAHPHALRHMYGTELAEDDVPTNTSSELLGHVEPKTTKIYEHLAVRKLTRVVDKANPLAKMHTPIHDLIRTLDKR